MKILFTGSRAWKDEDAVVNVFNVYVQPGDHVVVGDCPTGLDKMIRDLCQASGVSYEVHYADWKKHGRAAGPKRNQAMVDTGPDLCIGFPLGDSRGTRGCMKFAGAAGIPVITVDSKDEA